MKSTFISLLAILAIASSFAQTSAYYYYYNGQKKYITPDLSRIGVMFSQDFADRKITDISGNKLVRSFRLNSSSTFHSDSGKRVLESTHYAEIVFESKLEADQYQSTVLAYQLNPDIAMTAPCFISENGQFGISDKFLVRLKESADKAKLMEMAKKVDAVLLGSWEYEPLCFMLRAKKNHNVTALDLANLFYESSLFEYAIPEMVYHNIATSSDPFFADQWGVKNTGQYSGISGIDVKAENAWSIATGTGVKVAIFDGGIQANHPDLQANMDSSGGYDAQSNSTPSTLHYGAHGTACAGIVGAVQNSAGITGIAPNCKLMAISVDSNVAGVTSTMLANGFYWAANNAVDIINCSWGCDPSTSIDNAINYAFQNGRNGRGNVIVFSTGNGAGSLPISYPANSNDKILAVGAINQCGYRVSDTATGSQLCGNSQNWSSRYGPKLDIVAPGIRISTTDLTGNASDAPLEVTLAPGDYNPWIGSPNDYTNQDYTKGFLGTSAAAPFVSGVAALVLSVNPNLTTIQVNDIIERTAQKISAGTYSYATTAGRSNGTWMQEMGYGLVNAYEAVLLAKCNDHLVITDPIFGANNRQASSTITANNTLSSAATVIYHAGTSVTLQNGFHSASGSKFRAYIEGCTDLYVGKNIADSKNETISDEKQLIQQSHKYVTVFPNPSRSQINISSSSSVSIDKVSIFSIEGKRIYTFDTPKENFVIDISALKNGTYIAIFELSNGSTESQKLVKN